MEVHVKIIREKRRTISLNAEPNNNVILRAPKFVSDEEIKKFLDSKRKWIEKRFSVFKGFTNKKLSADEIKDLKIKAEIYVKKHLFSLCDKVGVKPKKVSIKAQKTLWGSCTYGGNLNINCLIALLPDFAAEYVIVHELCHLKAFNHSRVFWLEVEKVLPNYRTARKYIKENGCALLWQIK